MRRTLAMALALALIAAIAPSAAAAPATIASGTSYYAFIQYVSDLDPYAPGIHSSLTITYSSNAARWSDGAGAPARSAESLVQVVSFGYVAGSAETWYGVYELVSSADPPPGAVSPSLRQASVQSGELALSMDCQMAQCPTLPSKITVAANWTGTGPEAIDVHRLTDSLGAVYQQTVRSRPADSSFAFTYPAGGGPLVIPRYLRGARIGSTHQVTTGVAPGTGADMILGSGTRSGATFDFRVLVASSGIVSGRFDSTFATSLGLPLRGTVNCAWTKIDLAVFGGLIDGADPALPASYFVVMVRDGPEDGLTWEVGRPDCDATGLGEPATHPIASGDIVVIDR